MTDHARGPGQPPLDTITLERRRLDALLTTAQQMADTLARIAGAKCAVDVSLILTGDRDHDD